MCFLPIKKLRIPITRSNTKRAARLFFHLGTDGQRTLRVRSSVKTSRKRMKGRRALFYFCAKSRGTVPTFCRRPEDGMTITTVSRFFIPKNTCQNSIFYIIYNIEYRPHKLYSLQRELKAFTRRGDGVTSRQKLRPMVSDKAKGVLK